VSSNTNKLVGPTTIDTVDPSLIISVVARDPNGLDDVIGGVVRDPGTENTYGTLEAIGNELAYEMTIPWSEMNVVKAITQNETRKIEVVLFDRYGESTSDLIEVFLTCDPDESEDICDGYCVRFDTDEHCGRCDRACVDGAFCRNRQCFVPDCGTETVCSGQCVDVQTDPSNCGICGTICSSAVCTSGVCEAQ